ncbi:hypothetical protein J7E95_21850 [Streptomyces sp. ISL-14]|nr:hypothetical protein [Streptomyces sp. ISL-14]
MFFPVILIGVEEICDTSAEELAIQDPREAYGEEAWQTVCGKEADFWKQAGTFLRVCKIYFHILNEVIIHSYISRRYSLPLQFLQPVVCLFFYVLAQPHMKAELKIGPPITFQYHPIPLDFLLSKSASFSSITISAFKSQVMYFHTRMIPS